MHIGVIAFLVVVAGWMISGALTIPWIYGIGIAALAAMFLQSGGAGTVGVVSSIGSGIGSGVGKVFGFVKRLVIFTVAFIALALLVTKITGVSLAFTASGFQVLGLAIWGWPSNARWEFLLGVSSLMLVAGLAARAADGDWKITMKIFGVASVVIWLMLNLGIFAPATKAALPSGMDLDNGTARIVRLVVAAPGFVLNTPAKLRAWWTKSPAAKQAAVNNYAPPLVPVVVEFPLSGEGHATKDVGLKAYLDPTRTHTRPSKDARYVFVEDPDVVFDDLVGSNVNHQAWVDMPSGKYLVYPLSGDQIYFRWWQ